MKSVLDEIWEIPEENAYVSVAGQAVQSGLAMRAFVMSSHGLSHVRDGVGDLIYYQIKDEDTPMEPVLYEVWTGLEQNAWGNVCDSANDSWPRTRTGPSVVECVMSTMTNRGSMAELRHGVVNPICDQAKSVLKQVWDDPENKTWKEIHEGSDSGHRLSIAEVMMEKMVTDEANILSWIRMEIVHPICNQIAELSDELSS